MKTKCISLWQPWASAIALGFKQIETRGFRTSYRGPIAIHAARRWTVHQQVALANIMDAIPEAKAAFRALSEIETPLPLGKIVAIAEIVDCVSITPDFAVTDEEFLLGDYSPNRFAWRLKNVVALPKPFAYTGRQGFFEANLPKELLP